MLQRNSSILWRELDGEAVLLDPAAGCSYNLNSAGTVIWKLSDGAHSSADIATILCQLYEVEYSQALQDVERLISELHAHHLLLHLDSTHHPMAD